MNTGKTLFAQLMDFLPWTTFTRIVDRYGGDHRVRTLSCAEQYRSMAFAQLTYRESLRDIETCLRSTHRNSITWASKPVRRSTLACQRKARLAYPCGVGPAAHHPEDAVRRRRTGVGPTNTVYALDSRPSLCACRSFRGRLPHHQGGGEDAHAARPAGQHSKFYPHLGWQAARRSCPRYALAGSREPSTPWMRLRRLCPPLCVAPSRGLLRHACQVEHRCSSRLFGADGSLDRHHLRPESPWTASIPVRITPNFCGHPLQGPRVRQDAGFITNNFSLPAATVCALYKSRWQVELFFKWIKQHLRIQFYGTSRGRRRSGLPSRSTSSSPSSRSASTWTPRSTLWTDPLGDPLRENAHTSSTCGRRKQMQRFANNQPIEFIRFLTGH